MLELELDIGELKLVLDAFFQVSKMKVKRCSSTEREVYRLELWIKGKEIYKGERKADNDQSKP